MTLKIAVRFVLYGGRGIALSKQKRFYSLSFQLFCAVLLSLLVAVAIFIPCYTLGNSLLDKTIYGHSFITNMADKKFSKLQEYVQEENVTQADFSPLDRWCRHEKKVHFAIYKGEQILYKSRATSKVKLDSEQFDPSLEDPDCEYSLVLNDGTKIRVFLYYFAGEAYYYWTIVLSALISFVAFSICFIFFIHRKLQYIKHLKTELDILAGGDLTYQVTIKSGDELGELADGIDQMRRSILAHQKSEEKMRFANSQLVTAMSHDLRTPMTSLLVYLELLNCGKYENDEQLQHFISRSLEKTLQIKDMADKLFEYFLVYTSEWEPPDTECVDADMVFQQFWGEYIFSLENHGFCVTSQFGELQGCFQVNIDLLRRAFDNLYSNILKYGDPSAPVEISYSRVGTEVYLVLSNRVLQNRDEQESSNIGLNTCMRILSNYDGSLQTQEENGRFSVMIVLPLKK